MTESRKIWPLSNSQAKLVRAWLRHCSGSLYLVGGYVRDVLMDLGPSQDLDIVCEQRQVQRCQEISRRLGWEVFVLDSKRGHWRLRNNANENLEEIDIAPLQGSDITQDLALRDCTANAMAVEISTAIESGVNGTLLDPHGGLRDLANKTLRPISLGNLEDDPLRMLRLVRLAHTHGLKLLADTVAFVESSHASMEKVSGERIREEGWRILVQGRLPLSHSINLLHQTCLYESVFGGVGQAWSEERNCYLHGEGLAFLDRVDRVAVAPSTLEVSETELEPGSSPLVQTILKRTEGVALTSQLSRRSWWLRLALLSLPLLTHAGIWQRHRQMNMAEFQAGLPSFWRILKIHLRFMAFSKLEAGHCIKVLCGLNKLLVATLTQQPGFMECREVHRLIMDSGHTRQVSVLLDVMLLLSKALETPEQVEDHLLHYYEAWQETATSLLERTNYQRPTPLASGKELQDWFGISPGPQIGKLIAQVIEAEACQLISTPEEARRYLANLL